MVFLCFLSFLGSKKFSDGLWLLRSQVVRDAAAEILEHLDLSEAARPSGSVVFAEVCKVFFHFFSPCDAFSKLQEHVVEVKSFTVST